jgi:hypothetical protein
MLPWHRFLLIELDFKINIGGVLAKFPNPTTSHVLGRLDGSHSKKVRNEIRRPVAAAYWMRGTLELFP